MWFDWFHSGKWRVLSWLLKWPAAWNKAPQNYIVWVNSECPTDVYRLRPESWVGHSKYLTTKTRPKRSCERTFVEPFAALLITVFTERGSKEKGFKMKNFFVEFLLKTVAANFWCLSEISSKEERGREGDRKAYRRRREFKGEKVRHECLERGRKTERER